MWDRRGSECEAVSWFAIFVQGFLGNVTNAALHELAALEFDNAFGDQHLEFLPSLIFRGGRREKTFQGVLPKAFPREGGHGFERLMPRRSRNSMPSGTGNKAPPSNAQPQFDPIERLSCAGTDPDGQPLQQIGIVCALLVGEALQGAHGLPRIGGLHQIRR